MLLRGQRYLQLLVLVDQQIVLLVHFVIFLPATFVDIVVNLDLKSNWVNLWMFVHMLLWISLWHIVQKGYWGLVDGYLVLHWASLARNWQYWFGHSLFHQLILFLEDVEILTSSINLVDLFQHCRFTRIFSYLFNRK